MKTSMLGAKIGHFTCLWMSGQMSCDDIKEFAGEFAIAIPSILMGVDRPYLEWSL